MVSLTDDLSQCTYWHTEAYDIAAHLAQWDKYLLQSQRHTASQQELEILRQSYWTCIDCNRKFDKQLGSWPHCERQQSVPAFNCSMCKMRSVDSLYDICSNCNKKYTVPTPEVLMSPKAAPSLQSMLSRTQSLEDENKRLQSAGHKSGRLQSQLEKSKQECYELQQKLIAQERDWGNALDEAVTKQMQLAKEAGELPDFKALESRIQELEIENERLRNELQAKIDETEEGEIKISQLEFEAFQQLLSANNELKKHVENVESANESLKSTKSQLAAELASLPDPETLKNMNVSLRDQVSELQGACEKERIQLQEAMEDKDIRIKALNDMIKRMRSPNGSEGEWDEEPTFIQMSKDEVKSQRAKIELRDKEIEKLKLQLRDKDQELNRNQSSMREDRQRMQTRIDDFGDMSREKGDLQATLATTQRDLETFRPYKDMFEDLRQQKFAVDGQLAILQTELETFRPYKEMHEKLRQEKLEVDGKLAVATNELVTFKPYKDQHESLLQERQEEQLEFQRQTTRLSTEVENLNSQVGELTTENKKQVARVKERQATIVKANADLEETKTQMAEQKQKSKTKAWSVMMNYEKRCKGYIDKIAELEAELASVQERYEAKERQFKMLQTEYGDYVESMEARLREQTENHNKQAEQYEEEIRILKEQLYAVKNEMNGYYNIIRGKDEQIADLTNQINELNVKIEELYENFDLRIRKTIERTRKQCEDQLRKYGESSQNSDGLFNRCIDCKFELVAEPFSRCKNCVFKKPCRKCKQVRQIPRAGLCDECLTDAVFFCASCQEHLVKYKGDRCDHCTKPKCSICKSVFVRVQGDVCEGCSTPELEDILSKREDTPVRIPTCAKCNVKTVFQEGDICIECQDADKIWVRCGELTGFLYRGQFCKKCASVKAEYFCSRCQFERVKRPGEICKECQPDLPSPARIPMSPPGKVKNPKGREFDCNRCYTRFRSEESEPTCFGCRSTLKECQVWEIVCAFDWDDHKYVCEKCRLIKEDPIQHQEFDDN